jgi:MFS family permease
MALMAAGQSVAFPNVAALISRAADADHQGQFLGLNNATGALARVAGPMAGQLMFANVSANGPFILAACVALPTILLPLTVSQGKEKLGGPCRSPQTPRHL